MKQSHKTVLKRLSNGERTELELTTGEVSATAHAQHTLRYLSEAQQLGFCVKVGDAWTLTNAGRQALNVKPVAKQTAKITSWGMKEYYKGEDLRRLANRAGCYDFLDLPSRMHDGLHYRKDAKYG